MVPKREKYYWIDPNVKYVNGMQWLHQPCANKYSLGANAHTLGP